MLKLMPSFVGRAFHGVRPGLGRILANDVELAGKASGSLLRVHSPAFANHDAMPERFTADGLGTSPPLEWEGVPKATQEFLLLVEDADSPTAQPLVHCIAYKIAPTITHLAEGALNGMPADGAMFRLGRNSLFGFDYLPPDPPPGHGRHRYCFEIFALDRALLFDHRPDRRDAHHQMRGAVIGAGYLVGLYDRG